MGFNPLDPLDVADEMDTFMKGGGMLSAEAGRKAVDDKYEDKAKKEKKKAEEAKRKREQEAKKAAAAEAAQEEDRKRSNRGQSRRATILTGAGGLQSGNGAGMQSGSVNRRTLLGG